MDEGSRAGNGSLPSSDFTGSVELNQNGITEHKTRVVAVAGARPADDDCADSSRGRVLAAVCRGTSNQPAVSSDQHFLDHAGESGTNPGSVDSGRWVAGRL